MAQTTNPDWMTFDERMTETAGILAAGILRGRKRQMNQIKKTAHSPTWDLIFPSKGAFIGTTNRFRRGRADERIEDRARPGVCEEAESL